MRDRLRPGGVAVVWIQGYLMFDEDFRTLARTFQSVFPEAHLWSASPYDLVFTGHLAPLDLDLAAIDQRLAALDPEGLPQWTGLTTHRDLQRHYLMGPGALAALAGEGPLHTDADPFLEFTAPRALFTEEGLLDPVALVRERAVLPAGDPAILTARRDAARAIELAALTSDLPALEAALEADPTHPWAASASPGCGSTPPSRLPRPETSTPPRPPPRRWSPWRRACCRAGRSWPRSAPPAGISTAPSPHTRRPAQRTRGAPTPTSAGPASSTAPAAQRPPAPPCRRPWPSIPPCPRPRASLLEEAGGRGGER